MVKKTVFILLLSLILIPVFAAEYEPTATFDGTASATAGSKMSLDLTAASYNGHVVVGFSSNAITSINDVPSGVATTPLAADKESGIATNTDTSLYVFYQIQSAEELTLTLYAEKALDYAGTPDVTGEDGEIYFDVTGVKAAGADTSGSASVTFVNGIDENGEIDSPEGFGSAIENTVIYVHKPSTSIGEAGSYKLTVTTEDYRQKAMGRYSTNLILSVVGK